MIEVKNIKKKYGSKSVVDDVSITIKKGKITSFIGPNGAGKSTLLGMITRLIKQDSGQVIIEGVKLEDWKSDDLAKKIAILKQSNHLDIKLSVKDLVAFGRYPHSKGRLNETDRIKIDQALNYMELDSIKDKFLDELSGGQKQRAFIGMILAQDSEYIFLDEPLNNLDMKHSVQIMRTLKRITHELGKTVVLVIHDINFASCYSDEILALQEGKVIAYDRTDTIINEDILCKMYDIEFNIQTINDQKICVYY